MTMVSKHPHILPSFLQLVLLVLTARNAESLHVSSRRDFFVKAATSTTTIAFGGAQLAHAAIDVSGLPVEQSPQSNARGVDPRQLKSGPLAGTKLGFQVGGGPRSEEVVRAIDQPRYEAVRKTQGLGPMFLDGVPRETQPEKIQADFDGMK